MPIAAFSTTPNNENEGAAEPDRRAIIHNAQFQDEDIKGNSINLDGVNLYDELKTHNEIDTEDNSKENRTKNLSLKLLNSNDPVEILNIFESDILRSQDQEVHGEELCLVLKFF